MTRQTWYNIGMWLFTIGFSAEVVFAALSIVLFSDIFMLIATAAGILAIAGIVIGANNHSIGEV